MSNALNAKIVKGWVMFRTINRKVCKAKNVKRLRSEKFYKVSREYLFMKDMKQHSLEGIC